MKHPYIARGLDLQGRQPEAAHAYMEIGLTNERRRQHPRVDLDGAGWLIVAVLGALAFWTVLIMALLAVFYPHAAP